MHKTFQAGLSLAFLILSFNSFAGGPPPATTTTTYNDVEESKDEAFIGFNWALGGSLTPELILGFRSVDVNSDGDVEGAGTSISFSLLKTSFDKIKVFGIKGNDDLAGELGFGFSLLNQSWLGTLGAQGDHFNIGADLLKQGGFQLNGQLNSTDYEAPDQEKVVVVVPFVPPV
ncbi:hypothetical protein [Amphritea sp.]|uniref:hypothetical protein n=1 Tax=Amphritea sp. TaxID=1872502 RepID=UPI0025BB1FDD|nr:hypothetical protein [Amphritea sp.]